MEIRKSTLPSSEKIARPPEAEIYFSDDDRRLMVYMKSNIQGFPGALELYLKDYQPGVPLNADSRAEAAQAREARAQAAADVGRQ